MKLSKNMRQEIRLHLVFVCGAWVIAPLMYFTYQIGYFPGMPAWMAVCFGLLMSVLLYIWFRQGLSRDKTQIKPRIW